jgi:hypothetical protein
MTTYRIAHAIPKEARKVQSLAFLQPNCKLSLCKQPFGHSLSEKSYSSGSLCTVDLLVHTILNQLMFYIETVISLLQNK